MTTAIRPQTLVVSASNALRAGWVAEYRRQVPAADCWARRLRNQAHSTETQERVFRMAEQVARRGVARQDLFASLEEADRSVATAVNPEAAANAGYLAIAPLVPLAGAPIVIGGDDGPDSRRWRAVVWAVQLPSVLQAGVDRPRPPLKRASGPGSRSATPGHR